MFGSWWSARVKNKMIRAAARGTSRTRFQMEALEGRENPAGISVIGADAGSAPIVTVYDASTQAVKFTITAYDSAFTGGVHVAIGDVNGDGIADVITGAGVGGGPEIKVFSGVDGSLLGSMTAGDTESRSGVSVAAADFDGDGKADIVAGTMQGGNPLVQVLRFSDSTVLHSYTPFAGAGSVNVAAGDVNGDGTPDVITAVGQGGGPRITVYSGANDQVLYDFFTFEESFTGGVNLAVGDMNQDGYADIITSASKGGGPRVQIFNGQTGNVLQNFFAYDSTLREGVQALAFDANGDGVIDLVTSQGNSLTSNVLAFNPSTLASVTFSSVAGLQVTAEAIDTAAPTVTLTSTAGSASKTTPFAFTATFSEAVNGFSATGLTVTNGTISNFTKVNSRTYTFDVTPTAEGTVTVGVTAGVATDAVGYGNVAATPVSISYDLSAPAVTANTLISKSAIPTLTGTVDDSAATVTVQVAGQTITATVSGNTWSAAVPQVIAEGTYDISVMATDTAGNSSSASVTGGLTIDLTAPTVTLATDSLDTTSVNPIPFTATLSESVANFTAESMTVTNGSVANFVDLGSGNYTFNIVPSGTGVVSVSVAAGAVTDAAGNANLATDVISRTYDGVVTTAAITSTVTGPTNSATIPVTVTFSGDVTGFDESDLAVTNGTVSNFVAMNASSYSFDVAPTNDGEVSISIAAAAATDGSGNPTSAATAWTVAVDRTAPTVTVSSTATSPTSASAIPVTVTFNESVTDLTESGIVVTNGTISNFLIVDSHSATFDITPTSNGDVTVTVSAGAVTDTAGNANLESNVFSITYDDLVPAAPTIVSLDATSESGSSLTDGVTDITNPTVIGTAVADTTVELFANSVSVGTAVTDSSGNWSITSSALSNGTYSLTAIAHSTTGQSSLASTPYTVVIDGTAPAATVDSNYSTALTGTADGTGSAVATVDVSVLDSVSGMYWNGSDFTSASEVFVPATVTPATATTATWSLNLAVSSTDFTVRARATDLAGNQAIASGSVTHINNV